MSLFKGKNASKQGYSTFISSRLHEDNVANVPADVQAQNVPSSRLYVFGNDCTEEVSVEDSALELSELRPRGRGTNALYSTARDNHKKHILELKISPHDSLQRFALQYGCTVAEIKRANNLYSDQDFYALETLKIPVQPHGLLTERKEEMKQREQPLELVPGTPSTSVESNDKESIGNGDCVRTVSIRSALDSPNSFLRHMDEDIRMICQTTHIKKASLEEVARTLTINCIHPLKRQQGEKNLGTACGMGWKGIMILVVIVAVVIPALVAFLCLSQKRCLTFLKNG